MPPPPPPSSSNQGEGLSRSSSKGKGKENEQERDSGSDEEGTGLQTFSDNFGHLNIHEDGSSRFHSQVSSFRDFSTSTTRDVLTSALLLAQAGSYYLLVSDASLSPPRESPTKLTASSVSPTSSLTIPPLPNRKLLPKLLPILRFPILS